MLNLFYVPLCCCDSVCVVQPPQPNTPEVLETEANNTPEPKQWVSLGSEQEIDEESVRETREKVLLCIINTLNMHINHTFFSAFRCVFYVISFSTSSPECKGNLGYQSVLLTATLQMLRMASWSVLPTKTADSASSRCRGTVGYRQFPNCRAAALRHSGMPGN